MIGYIIQRIVLAIPMLIGITLVSFFIMQSAPGDALMMGMDPAVDSKDIAQITQNLGLDQPIIVQYWIWIKHIVTGNFGYSYISGKPVVTMILERLPATLLLAVSSLVCILCLALPLGLISGYKKDSWVDNIITVTSFLGMSIPSFWFGLMLILLFSYGLGWLPTSGYMSPFLYDAPIRLQLLSIAHHMILPLATIVLGGLAGMIRFNRFSVIKIIAMDCITAARARGLSERRILFKHAFKNVLLPVITLLGMELPSLISGSFVIEYIFSWPGMGQLGLNAVYQRDYPILMACILFSAVLIIVGNILSDIGYAYVDPRIQKREKI